MKILIKRVQEDVVGIFICDTDSTGKITHVVSPAELKFEPVKEGEKIKPSFAFAGQNGDIFLREMLDSLNKFGIKTDNESRLAGALTATEKHLEDLRKMLRIA